MNLLLSSPDPLDVLSTTLPVVQHARYVRLSMEGIERVAANIQDLTPPPAAWGDDLHLIGERWQTAGWVLVLDALNFCFWSEDPDRRWRVEYGGTTYDGYWALVAALRRAVDEGFPMWDATFLRRIDRETVQHILRPTGPDDTSIPLLGQRHAILAELGGSLIELRRNQPRPAGTSHAECLVLDSSNSAVALVHLLTTWIPSFRDFAMIDGKSVSFLKRAQILAADLNSALLATGDPGLDDMDALTAFPDYKVPQVLRRLGVIEYTADLASRIDAWELIAAGSREENEIRSATIWGVELIRQALNRLGRPMSAYEIDWALWQAGQTVSADDRPYHRTLTIYY